MKIKRGTSRRSFLIGVGVALVAFVPAFSQLTSAEDPETPTPSGEAPTQFPRPKPPTQPPPQGPMFSPRSVSGIAIKVEPNAITIDAGTRGEGVVRTSPSTTIWKGDYDWGLPIELGDDIKARARDLIVEDGPGRFHLDAENIYANIVNLIGQLSSVATTSRGYTMILQDRHGRAPRVEIDERTYINRASTNSITTFGSDPIVIKDGGVLQVIGLDRKDDTVLARRIFVE